MKGSGSFDGSNNITITTTQDNIAILTGSVNLKANTSENAANGYCTFTEVVINYPPGFSSQNSIVISCSRPMTYCEGYGWHNYPDSQDLYEGTLPITVALYKNDNGITSTYRNKIRIGMGNLSTQKQTGTYKIILMKI